MVAPSLAISWELVRKNRALIIVALIVPAIWSQIFGFEIPIGPHVMRRPAAKDILGLAISAMAIVVGFSFVETDDQGGSTGPPKRLFVLPVRNLTLVLCPMLLGVTFVSIIFLAWYSWVFEPQNIEIPWKPVISFCAALLTSFQAIIWSLNAWPKVRAGAIAIWMIILLVVFQELTDFTSIFDKAIFFPIALLTPIASFGVALYGVAVHRRELSSVPDSLPVEAESTTNSTHKEPDIFTSPENAQLWLEIKGNAFVPMSGLVLMIVVMAGCAGWFQIERNRAGFTIAWLILIKFLFIIWALISGIIAARDSSIRHLGISEFLSTRPISNAVIVFAKAKLFICLWICGLIAFVVSLAIWFACYLQIPDEIWKTLHESMSPYVIETTITTMLIVPWVLVGGLPVWTSARIRNKTWLGVILLAALIGLFKAFDYASRIHLEIDTRLLFLIGVLLFGTKVSLSLGLFIRCGRKGTLTARSIMWCFMIWLLGSLSLGFVLQQCSSANLGEGLWILPLFSLVIFPLNRFAMMTIVLQRSRKS